MHYARRDGGDLHFEEVHRFEDTWTESDAGKVWNVDHLVSEIVAGLEAVESETGRVDSLGIDATAASFGFVADGELIEEPYFYLEPSLYSMESEIRERVTTREVFEHTGHPHLPNPCYYLCHRDSTVPEEADRIVPIPGVLSGELGAEMASEESYAMTLYIMDPREREWALDFLETLDLPTDPLPDLVPPGEQIGSLGSPHADRIDSDPDVILPPGHDTASAMAALPLIDDNRTFLATGSWLIPGLELPEPVISDEAFAVEASNEISVDGNIRLLRNVPGFSLLEHCRETWKREGGLYEYDELLAAVAETDPHGPLVDPLDDRFFEAQRTGEVVATIEHYCDRTGQTPPEGEAEITRCLMESLAARSASVIDDLDALAEGSVDRIHLCGGGVRNGQFCRMVAAASGSPVTAGPVEATAIGNALSQMVSGGEIASYDEARRLIDEHVDFDRYQPRDRDAWRETMDRFEGLIE